MKIVIVSIGGKNIELDVSTTDTILDIKNKLIPYTGLDVVQQVLICNGKNLKNDDTLEQSKVIEGTTINIVVGLRGG